MKFCPINPIPDLETLQSADNDMHLLLTQLGSNNQYSNFYAHRRRSGDYLIIDNGAYEFNKSLPLHDVLEYAWHLEAHEIVVPDVMGDSVETFDFFVRSLKDIPRDYNLMVVPQGEDIRSWEWCLRRMCDIYEGVGKDLTIGVSKIYEKFSGGRYGRVEYIMNEVVPRHEVDIHLLGYDKLTSLEAMVRSFPDIRSVDSAKPVVLAMHGVRYATSSQIRLRGSSHRRPKDYFDQVLTPEQIQMAQDNIDFVTAVAAGTLTIMS